MVIFQEVVKPFRDLSGDVRLFALLAYVCRNIPNDNQLLTAPHFQGGDAWTKTSPTTVDNLAHSLAFLVLWLVINIVLNDLTVEQGILHS